VHVDKRLIGVGVFFIVFGGVLLGARQGWIPADVVERLWQLWPLLLIGIGISIILSGRPGAWVGGLIGAACLGAMAAGLIQTGIVPFVGCGGDEAGDRFSSQSGELASQADVSLTFSCGELAVETGPGAAWSIVGSSEDGRSPSIRQDDSGLQVEPSSRNVFGLNKREDWDVTLPTDPTLGLDVTLNAGSGRLVLGGAHLSNVGVTVNAGSMSVDLREAAAIATIDGTINAGSSVTWLPELPLQGDLTVNAGSLVICAPEGLGLRLNTGDNPISSNDFDRAGLVRTDDGWETPGYATAPVRAELDVTANAGSLSLNPSQPCERQ
jgi:Domain of unknown function (DUF5668)